MSASVHSIADSQRVSASSTRREANFERWFVLVLGAFSAGLVGAIVGSFAFDTDPAAIATLATAGYLTGYLFARTHLPDILAHLAIVSIGVLVALAAIEPGMLYREVRAGDWRELAHRYGSLIRDFLDSAATGNRFETSVAVFAIGLTIWLVGSTSAWMLFRRGWVFWAVLTPGAILLMTLAMERERATWPALVYVGLSFGIAAGYASIQRQAIWSSRGIERPGAFGRRSVLLGALMAALAVGIGISFSFDLNDRFIEQATRDGDRLASWVENRFEGLNSNAPKSSPVSGNYGAFADQFKVGDGVPSGDTPIAVVDADSERYLAARRLDVYDGTGWQSSASMPAAGETQAPRIAFQPDQPMNIPREQLVSRVQDRATITLLHPAGDMLFTIDQHFSASEATLVRVGWEAIDESFQIGQVALGDIPVDLRELIALLQSETFAPRTSAASPEVESPQAAAELATIQNRLESTYPLYTELSWTDDGGILLHARGRLPVYSDIEAVYSGESIPDATYSVIGLAPTATVRELENAGTSYPDYILETYLQLPDSVTQETRNLAGQIVTQAGATTPFDQATAIQNYLRQHFTYQLDAGPAPDGRDIVDYFLFDSRVGRCDHYASSMVVMLRMLGVPARIVTGFAPAAFDSSLGGYVYRGRDTHAWVEVYFPGYGWIPFEPTPSQSPIDRDSLAEPTSAPEPTPTPEATSAPSTAGDLTTPEPTATATPLPAPATTDTEGTAHGENGWPSNLVLAGAIALLIAGLGGFLFWRRHRAFAGLPVAGANYGRLQRLGRFLGVESSPELTPTEYAVRFGAAQPKSAAGALVVADAFTRERYATDHEAGTIAQESEAGWKEAKQGASDWRLWRRR